MNSASVPGSNEGTATNGGASANVANDAAGSDFDSLLKLAENGDVGKLTQIKVSDHVPSMQTEVTTVSRTVSTVGKSPAAIFVITNDMIRRSGATNVPEVLRMAPGVEVARIDSNKYAITIRGFNNRFSNKLLVQIDGRTVYTPLFAGVYWDAQMVMLEDVDRIEVIRGPGATVWGANAVNGVINVISKTAGKTQGLFAQAGGGSYERDFGQVRYGGQSGDLDYRFYGMYNNRAGGEPTFAPFEPAGFDSWRVGQAGFRMDFDPGRLGDDIFTLQGDFLNGKSGSRNIIAAPLPPTFETLIDYDTPYSTQDGIARWTHKIDDERDWTVQAWYDNSVRDVRGLNFLEHRNTFDLDIQNRFPIGDDHKIVWGGGYRSSNDRLDYSSAPLTTISFSDDSVSLRQYSYFVQDTINLHQEEWFLTLGSKFQHYTYSDFEYQPTARLLYAPDERHSVWGAVSRAVRLPSRAEETLRLTLPTPFDAPVPVFAFINSNGNLLSEELLAWEIGYRAQPIDAFSWDLATFYNQYDNLIVFANGAPIITPFGVLASQTAANGASAESYGFELAASYEFSSDWTVRLAYSYISIFVHPNTGVSGPGLEDAEIQVPNNQLYLQSSWNPNERWQVDLIGRYVDALNHGEIPSYFAGDARLAYQWQPSAELFLVGRNLFDRDHPEFFNDGAVGGLTTNVRNEIYGGITIRY